MKTENKYFSKEEITIYSKMPLALSVYLLKDNKVQNILVSKGFCHLFDINKIEKDTSIDSIMSKRLYFEDITKLKSKTFDFYNNPKSFEANYRILIDNEYKWIQSKVYFLKVTKEYKIFIVTFLNIDSEKRRDKIKNYLKLNDDEELCEMENTFEILITQLNDLVIIVDSKVKKIKVYATKKNIAGFKEGYSIFSYIGFEKQIKDNVKFLPLEGLEINLSIKKILKDAIKNKINLTYKIEKDGKIYFKRIFSFWHETKCCLYSVVYDVTSSVLADQEINLKLSKSKIFEKANENKSIFLRKMSHDMRTPIGAVIANSQFGMDETKDENCKTYFSEIYDSSVYLLSLLNDILDEQKLENGKLHLIPTVFDIDKFNMTIFNIVNNKAKIKNIEFKFSKNYSDVKYIKFDKARLTQIQINLLNNAIKYTPEKGSVLWICNIEKENDNYYIKYVITDNGVGMTKKFQQRMYEPFCQETNKLSKIEDGSGLGLSIVRNIIEECNGTIFCVSAIGKGTTFNIKIPLTKITEREINAFNNNVIVDSIALKGKKVLLVEDIEINRRIAEKILTTEGMLVDFAENGKISVGKVKNNTYDAVLMDIRMPVMDGLTATKEIRKYNKTIPIIGLSANAFPEDIKISHKAGMNAYLSKPLNRKDMIRVLLKYTC